jgi:hypothetical protein
MCNRDSLHLVSDQLMIAQEIETNLNQFVFQTLLSVVWVYWVFPACSGNLQLSLHFLLA